MPPPAIIGLMAELEDELAGLYLDLAARFPQSPTSLNGVRDPRAVAPHAEHSDGQRVSVLATRRLTAAERGELFLPASDGGFTCAFERSWSAFLRTQNLENGRLLPHATGCA